MMKLAVLLVCFCLLVPAAAPAQQRPAGVLTDTVTQEQTSETISIFGELVAERQSRVAARIAGVADTVPVEVGDTVQDGDILATIDSDLLSIELARAEADLSVAKAAADTARLQVETAQTVYSRAERLQQRSIISEAVYDERLNVLSVAKGRQAEAAARVNVAEMALRRAKYDLDNAMVRAPFNGIVIEVGTEVGQFVALGSEVARLIDTDDIRVEANVPARFIEALQPDQTVYGTTGSGGAIVLKLRAALPTESSATRTRPVVFDVVSKEGIAAAGQSLTLDLPVSAPRSVPAVPKDALIQSRDGWQVFVAKDGIAEPRSVQIGIALGDRYEVTSGLSVGDIVVVRGNERLRPGQQIAPTPVNGAKQGNQIGDGGAAGPQKQAAARTAN
ncbi:efflux RND transporter periplasmic adaptor subunit [Roseibium denhamense]|uniref:RND family efflux transporter, MFP subunit n=1 Tax=Roseibium denhamense TaxID=76305 RepID=A0ABY1PL80_9HYPH|nr:efflux RND transporter periplasmic adaptor subunit [Roseibium denhamense]MTI06985.1 efflux RND transporter periplasmic adaptor subunit [Roseibium denhamense]SMP36664.1 RND family efflux transporter, MFP subunit [Roseibium denhamense]